MGDKLTVLLLVFYVLIVIAYLYDGKWWKALYWVGAILISIAILKMK